MFRIEAALAFDDIFSGEAIDLAGIAGKDNKSLGNSEQSVEGIRRDAVGSVLDEPHDLALAA